MTKNLSSGRERSKYFEIDTPLFNGMVKLFLFYFGRIVFVSSILLREAELNLDLLNPQMTTDAGTNFARTNFYAESKLMNALVSRELAARIHQEFKDLETQNISKVINFFRVFLKGWPQLELYFLSNKQNRTYIFKLLNCCLHRIVNPYSVAP